MKTSKLTAPLLVAGSLQFGMPGAASAHGINETSFDLRSQCTTKETGIDGARHACASEAQTYRAPVGFVIVQNEVKVRELSAAGDGHDCHVRYEDFVEVVPGITQPRTLVIWTTALGPGGYFSGRGWETCAVIGKIVQVLNH